MKTMHGRGQRGGSGGAGGSSTKAAAVLSRFDDLLRHGDIEEELKKEIEDLRQRFEVERNKRRYYPPPPPLPLFSLVCSPSCDPSARTHV
jgi:hypothetical protein